MTAYLLDTDWALDAIGGHPRSAGLLRRLPRRDVGISIITMGEVYDGAFSSPNPQAHLERSRRFLLRYAVLGLTDGIMERFAELRSQLRRRGNLIPDFDLLIAATALHHDLMLLTYNRRHFERVPDLRLYQPDAG